MLSLRPFESADADLIISWIKDEYSFRQWSADTYKNYPIEPADIVARYAEIKENHKGLVYPLMLTDGENTVGHLIVRVLDAEQGVIRFGYIIVDSQIRGKGYGSKMLRMALEYACDKLGAKRVTLGVFENNPNAYRCYKAVGFKQFDSTETIINGEPWKCLELEYIYEV
ncbi:MAG: GNAT family N-acetyltransferase [Ruminococcus sp.]|nr:GNAT family N-acetyltransferase [Ruminococcus sp.]